MNEVKLWKQAVGESTDPLHMAQISRLNDLYDDYSAALGHQRDGSVRYSVIESFPFERPAHSTAGPGTAFFLRDKNESSVYPDTTCVIAFANGSKRILRFQTGSAAIMDMESLQVAQDESLIETVLNGAEKDLSSRQSIRDNRRRNTIRRTVGAALCLAMTGGATYEIHDTFFGPDRGAIERLQFDKRDVQLPDSSAGMATSFPINFISESAYKATRQFKQGDALSSPERISIDHAQQCIDTNSPVNTGDHVAIFDTYGSADDVVAARNKGGSLSICRLDDEAGSSWEYVVQNFGGEMPSGIKTESVIEPMHTNVSEGFYKSIPGYHSGDPLSSPRLISVDDSESCKNTTTPLSPAESVRTSDIYGYDDDMIMVSNHGNAFSICRLDSDNAEWNTAVQIVSR